MQYNLFEKLDLNTNEDWLCLLGDYRPYGIWVAVFL